MASTNYDAFFKLRKTKVLPEKPKISAFCSIFVLQRYMDFNPWKTKFFLFLYTTILSIIIRFKYDNDLIKYIESLNNVTPWTTKFFLPILFHQGSLKSNNLF